MQGFEPGSACEKQRDASRLCRPTFIHAVLVKGKVRFYFACIVRCIGLCHYYQVIKRRIAQNMTSITEARKYMRLIPKSGGNCRKVVGSKNSDAKRRVSNVRPESMTAAPTMSPQARDTTCALMKLNMVDEKVTKVRERRKSESVATSKASAPPCTSQVAASSIRAVASPPANGATESRVSSVRSEKSNETRAPWAVVRELGRIAPCRKRPRIEVC